mgnify:CR=1 FL=1
MKKNQSNKDQRSFMLVFNTSKRPESASRSVVTSKPKVGYSIDKNERKEVRERLIRELKEFGS